MELGWFWALLLLALVGYNLKLTVEMRRWLVEHATDGRSRQSSMGVTRRFGRDPVVERARTTKRDSSDLPATARQSRIKHSREVTP